MFDSFVLSSKSFNRLRCARYFCSYPVWEKATETCSPVTHSSRLFSIYIWITLDVDRKTNQDTYHCQDNGNGCQREHVVFRKLRVHHAVIFFSPEPGLINERLDDRRKEYTRFLLRVLLRFQGLDVYSSLWNDDQKNSPYKYNELHRAVARPCRGPHAWMSVYLRKRQKPRKVLR
jgi:hypothetical protein